MSPRSETRTPLREEILSGFPLSDSPLPTSEAPCATPSGLRYGQKHVLHPSQPTAYRPDRTRSRQASLISDQRLRFLLVDREPSRYFARIWAKLELRERDNSLRNLRANPAIVRSPREHDIISIIRRRDAFSESNQALTEVCQPGIQPDQPPIALPDASPASWRAWMRLMADFERARPSSRAQASEIARFCDPRRDGEGQGACYTPLPAAGEKNQVGSLVTGLDRMLWGFRRPGKGYECAPGEVVDGHWGRLWRKPVPWLPDWARVAVREPVFWEPVERWQMGVARVGGAVKPLRIALERGWRKRWGGYRGGMRGRWVPRTEFPAERGSAVWGWRGQMVAWFTVACWGEIGLGVRMGWRLRADINRIGRGEGPWTVGVTRRLEAEIARCRRVVVGRREAGEKRARRKIGARVQVGILTGRLTVGR